MSGWQEDFYHFLWVLSKIVGTVMLLGGAFGVIVAVMEVFRSNDIAAVFSNVAGVVLALGCAAIGLLLLKGKIFPKP